MQTEGVWEQPTEEVSTLSVPETSRDSEGLWDEPTEGTVPSEGLWNDPTSVGLWDTPTSQAWLPDGFSRILRSYVFGPSGLKDYSSATLCCKIRYLLFLGLRHPPSTLAQSKER